MPSIDFQEQASYLLELHGQTCRLVHGCKGLDDSYSDTCASWGDWMPFQATHFIYAYFVFNSIYSQCNWKESIEQDKFVSFPEETTGETVQRNKLLKLLAEISTLEEFSKMVQAKLRDLGDQCREGEWQSQGYLWSAESLDYIEPDSRIKEKELTRYKLAWRNLFSDYRNSDDSYKKILIKLHELIYNVRCNIFHGRKRLVDMLDFKQRDRLLIYTSILHATNELFLNKVNNVKAKQKMLLWKRQEA